MKFAAIDIGSNGVRFFIARPLDLDNANPEFKKVEYSRLPLRLGDDVFSTKEISKKKGDLLVKGLFAFKYLMEIYNVDQYRVCATSAMRDAKNGEKLARFIKKETGITIEVISGYEESQLVLKAFTARLPFEKDFLHIDVGGGSTELNIISKNKAINSESFDIGTVRAREGKTKRSEEDRMHNWILSNIKDLKDVRAIGTGGNINKLFRLSGLPEGNFMHFEELQVITQKIEKHSQHERIYKLKLNPDRAEVIDFAGRIYLDVMRYAGIRDIMAPNSGLKDGIVQDLWEKHYLSLQTSNKPNL